MTNVDTRPSRPRDDRREVDSTIDVSSDPAWVDTRHAAKLLNLRQNTVSAMARCGRLGPSVRSNMRDGLRTQMTRFVTLEGIDSYLRSPHVRERRARVECRHELAVAEAADRGRLAFGPAADWLGATLGRPPSPADAAITFGVERQNIWAAKTRGLSVWTADTWAVRAGEHPCFIWGEQWWVLCAEE